MSEKISTILALIDMGSMALPEFQRGYVWNRDQVKALMTSLYKGYPVGSLLVWQTHSAGAPHRGEQSLTPGVVNLLLDGQQRITTLYGIIKGKPPKFFEGDTRAFSDLRFSLESEEFEFYAPIKMNDDSSWVDVTSLMKKGSTGLGEIIADLGARSIQPGKISLYASRVSKLLAIAEREIHHETVVGEDKTIDVVVDIFNKVNSGGTKLSKGDLALARISAGRPETREEMKSLLDKWRSKGYDFDFDWLLRNVNAILNGEAKFTFLHQASVDDVRQGLKKAESAIGTILDQIADRLGLDHSQVFFGRGSIPLLSHYVDKKGPLKIGDAEWKRLLFWYVQVAIRGRYSGSTESILDKDLASVEQVDGGFERLVGELVLQYGNLRIVPDHFSGWSLGARFYPVLYMMTRVLGAKDWGTGTVLKSSLLGTNSSLEVHHIFPKAELYKSKQKYTRAEVNAVANFCFLTKGTNLQISDKKPEEYFVEVEKNHPGALASQWIPMDGKLWVIENYREFLEARKLLLADAANNLLRSLYGTEIPTSSEREVRELPKLLGSILDEEEEEILAAVNSWVTELGLPPGEMSYELVDESGDPVAVLDLAWPNGLQERLSTPAALLLNESPELVLLVQQKGFRVFVDAEQFKRYVSEQVMAGVPR